METNDASCYLTKDFAEAVTLATCGVPFLYPDQRMMHTYKASFLREKGMKVKEAIAAGVRGEMVWIFKRTPECEIVANAFRAAWDSAKNNVTTLEQFEIHELATALATGLRNRRELSGDWKYVTPNVAIENGIGGVISINENTAPEVLERWGVKL